jgi:hypothetical protein
MIRGIGPTYAGKMVKAFGEKVFDIIEAEPDRLREVDGIRFGSRIGRDARLTMLWCRMILRAAVARQEGAVAATESAVAAARS